MKTEKNKQKELLKLRENLKINKFWCAVEELTLLLKENRKPIVNIFKKENPNDKEQILKLSLENLKYKLNEATK